MTDLEELISWFFSPQSTVSTQVKAYLINIVVYLKMSLKVLDMLYREWIAPTFPQICIQNSLVLQKSIIACPGNAPFINHFPSMTTLLPDKP